MSSIQHLQNVPSNQSKQQDLEEMFKLPAHSYIQYDRFTSAYYKDLTQQQYAINRAFQSNNFNWLRKLPDSFHHKKILDKRMQKVKNLVEQQKEQRQVPYQDKLLQRAHQIKCKNKQKIGNLGFFQLFQYKQSEYDLAKELANQQKQNHHQKMKVISQIDFRPSDVNKKFKYQNPFKYRDIRDLSIKNNGDYLFPFHIKQDDYNQYRQSQTRKRIISESSRLAGPFLPSMNQKTLGSIHKSKIQEILTDIEVCLRKNLNNYAYIIGVNKKDHIQVLFEDIHQKDLRLRTFMSNFCQHENMTKYKLKKDLMNYGNVENHYLLYTLVPPWVGAQIIGSNMNLSSSNIKNAK